MRYRVSRIVCVPSSAAARAESASSSRYADAAMLDLVTGGVRHAPPGGGVPRVHLPLPNYGLPTQETLDAALNQFVTYKTRLCDAFHAKGVCANGAACPHAHRRSDLRRPFSGHLVLHVTVVDSLGTEFSCMYSMYVYPPCTPRYAILRRSPAQSPPHQRLPVFAQIC